MLISELNLDYFYVRVCVCVCVYVSLLMESQPQSWVRLMKVKTMKPYTYVCRIPESKSNETERNSS